MKRIHINLQIKSLYIDMYSERSKRVAFVPWNAITSLFIFTKYAQRHCFVCKMYMNGVCAYVYAKPFIQKRLPKFSISFLANTHTVCGGTSVAKPKWPRFVLCFFFLFFSKLIKMPTLCAILCVEDPALRRRRLCVIEQQTITFVSDSHLSECMQQLKNELNIIGFVVGIASAVRQAVLDQILSRSWFCGNRRSVWGCLEVWSVAEDISDYYYYYILFCVACVRQLLAAFFYVRMICAANSLTLYAFNGNL